MTHEPESGFQPAVAGWFRREYGDAAVEEQDWLADEGWYADIVVECGWCRLFVEVENDAGSVRPGVGQAGGYAGSDPAGVPLVVVPRGHSPTAARLSALRRLGVPVREFDAGAGEWVGVDP